MHRIMNACIEGYFSKNHTFYQINPTTLIVRIISQLNIILTQHVDNPSNTCSMQRIKSL